MGPTGLKKAQEKGSMQKGCLFHSDSGCQYTSDHVRKIIGRWAEQSMSVKGYCYDKAFAETCFATIKAEMLPGIAKSLSLNSMLAGPCLITSRPFTIESEDIPLQDTFHRCSFCSFTTRNKPYI